MSFRYFGPKGTLGNFITVDMLSVSNELLGYFAGIHVTVFHNTVL